MENGIRGQTLRQGDGETQKEGQSVWGKKLGLESGRG